MDTIRLKGKTALSLIMDKENNINIFEKNIFNKCLTTDEYKLIIQDVINLYRKGKNLNELLDIIKNSEYLYMNNRFDNIRYKIEEYDSFILKPFEVEEGVLTCNKCGSNKTFSYTKQTRGGDESTTVFAICSNCDARWKI